MALGEALILCPCSLTVPGQQPPFGQVLQVLNKSFYQDVDLVPVVAGSDLEVTFISLGGVWMWVLAGGGGGDGVEAVMEDAVASGAEQPRGQ